MNEQHLKSVPEAIIKEVQGKLNEAYDLLKPFIVNLTPYKRRELPKMGDKTLAFVEKSYEFAGQNPEFRPSYLNMEAFKIDIEDAVGLRVLQNTCKQLLQSIDDTSLLGGSEAYQQALIFYNSVKYAASQDVPGAKAVYEDLKTRFQRVKIKKSDDEIEVIE